jgi:erythronate-4-phosphate dehydrogenase
MNVVVDRDIPFIKGVLEKYADVVYLEGRAITRNDLLKTDALIIRTRTKCDRKLLEGTSVRFIASATIGYDHIDTAYCESHNIHWTNAAGCNSSSVQQYISAALFEVAKKLDFQLSNKTIGIVGVGNVGGKVAKICTALRVNVLLNDPPRERREGGSSFASLDAVIEQADIITLHVPLNLEGEDKTFHLVDEKLLSGLRKDQILFNTSRGEVVDAVALKQALRGGKLAACVLDVWEDEPEIDLELLDLVDIGTPHIAGYSADGKANGTATSIQALSGFFGLPIDSWYPESVPLPTNTLIEVDCSGLDQQEVMRAVVHHTHDIIADDLRLRKSPNTFEKQRAEYPLRREFPAYAVKLVNAGDNIQSVVREFGFRTSIS